MRRHYLLYLLFVLFGLQACGGVTPPGKYCSTVPRAGSCPSGYSIITLESSGNAIQRGINNNIYYTGRWNKVDGGIRISGLRHSGTYRLSDHPHGRGIGRPGKVYSLNSGTHLFPL